MTIDAIDSTDTALVQPGLYIVSTPIGNLRDITLRALDVLRAADLVLCEDTRVSGKLLKAYDLKKRMMVYNDHADDGDRAKIIQYLGEGQVVALISDAGTPLISDPGFKLLQDVHDSGAKVTPVPGASALLPAIQLSALPSDHFFFGGFLPNKQNARRKTYESFRDVPGTLVFYESPKRMEDSIKDAFAVLGDRPVALVREITKMFEEVKRGNLAAWANDPSLMGILKGECVLLIGQKTGEEFTEDSIKEMLSNLLKEKSLKDAVTQTCDVTKASKKMIYDLALKIRDENA